MEHLENPQPTEEEVKVREIVKDELFRQSQQQTASADNGWHEFSKIERYLEALIRVASVQGHKVHDEINEAVKKLKELAYQG